MPRARESFHELLIRLEPESSDTQEAYARVRHRLVKFFQWKGCDDSEELADDTIARFFQKYDGGTEIHADNLYSYLYGIAFHVFQEFLRRKGKEEKIKNNWTPPSALADKYLDCKKQCFEKLSSDKQVLLERYYGSNEAPEAIAKTLGISVGALRLRICRIKEDLRRCYQYCRGR